MNLYNREVLVFIKRIIIAYPSCIQILPIIYPKLRSKNSIMKKTVWGFRLVALRPGKGSSRAAKRAPQAPVK